MKKNAITLSESIHVIVSTPPSSGPVVNECLT